jgi:hypothetical protein
VFLHLHSAKSLFAEWQKNTLGKHVSLSSANNTGQTSKNVERKKHSAVKNTDKQVSLPSVFLCRVSKYTLPNVFFMALGKTNFCLTSVFYTRSKFVVSGSACHLTCKWAVVVPLDTVTLMCWLLCQSVHCISVLLCFVWSYPDHDGLVHRSMQMH